jgi:hypothetical protein
LQTLLPNDSPLSDFGSTLPGKILGGVAGVRPAAPNTAGKTEQPLARPTGGEHEMAGMQGGGGGDHYHVAGDINIHQPADYEDFRSQMKNDDHWEASAAHAAIPANSGGSNQRPGG